MVVYILIIMVAEFAVIIIGLVLDRIYPALSLTVSLSLFFVVLWLGWVLAVRVTEPTHQKTKSTRPEILNLLLLWLSKCFRSFAARH